MVRKAWNHARENLNGGVKKSHPLEGVWGEEKKAKRLVNFRTGRAAVLSKERRGAQF